jgi:hypothetical protein
MKHGSAMRLKVLGNLVRRLKARIGKQPKIEGQRVILTDEMIDNVLLKDSGDREGLEELIGSVVNDWIEQIELLNESLRGKN